MSQPDFEQLLNAIGKLSDSILERRPFMIEMRNWVSDVFKRITQSGVTSVLKDAWDSFKKSAKDKEGVELIEAEIVAVTKSCEGAILASRKADKKDVLNAAATLMDSIKEDVRLPPTIQIIWNAAREAVDVAKG